MELKTYRAASLQEALAVVRRELGPEASVLHTREVRPGLVGWLTGGRQIEVTASNEVRVPSRLPRAIINPPVKTAGPQEVELHADFLRSARRRPEGDSVIERMWAEERAVPTGRWPAPLEQLQAQLRAANLDESVADELVERIATQAVGGELADPPHLLARAAGLLEQELRTTGPIPVDPGQRRVVALVGPTGVGKTTTLAKLAASHRLREKQRVGLITVDTYRIAAVEQLRTYAEIIDLPMEVASTPREMKAAIDRLAHLDLVLVDTAGRGPRDEVRIAELRALLAEAHADDVYLVQSAVASADNLIQSSERFAPVGVTSLLLTKLDEAAGLGNIVSLCRASRLPVSYLTNGQNVPDDIEPADRRRLARTILGLEA